MGEVKDVLERLCDCPDDTDLVAAMCPIHDYINFRAAQMVGDEACREVAQLRYENKRLRKALQKIVGWSYGGEGYCHPEGCWSPKIAREALESTEPDDG